MRPGIPDVGLKGVSGPATGVDRPSSVSSTGARGASDEERGSSSPIIFMFALSLPACMSDGEPGCQGGKPPCKQAKRVRPEGGCGVIPKEIFLIFYYFFPKKMTKFDHHFEAKD